MASSEFLRPSPTALRTRRAGLRLGLGRLAVEAVEAVEGLELATDHRADQLELGGLGDQPLLDEPAVAQDRHPVGDLVDLVEEVGDEDDRHALVAQAAHHREELLHLVGVEAGRGLVEDQHLGLDVDGTRDGHELLDRDRVLVERRARVDVDAEVQQGPAGPAIHLAHADRPEAPRLPAEHHVLGDGEVGDQVHLLVDGADAGGLGRRGRVELVGLTLDAHTRPRRSCRPR